MPAHHGKYVAYYRVSTDRQGKSGLGLEAQKAAVADRLNGGRWQLVAEFVEVGGEGDGARTWATATYLETHAHRAYGARPEPETAAAKAILTHIRKGNLKDGFSARDVQRHGWSNLSDREQVQAGLNLLATSIGLSPWKRGTRDAAAGPPPTTTSTQGPSDDRISEQVSGDAEGGKF